MNVQDQVFGQGWAAYCGDSCEVMRGLPDESIDLTVSSPPFSALFVYSASERDLGNSGNRGEFLDHFGYIIRELFRVTRPGRIAAIHVQQVATTLAHDGVIGLSDFRGDVIRAFQAGSWVYHGEVVVDKDPQQQAIRTHAKALLFVQFRKDSSWSRPAYADYVLFFRKPGDAVPVHPDDLSNEDWIRLAHPVWFNVRESNTLNVAAARGNEDERHICPLQLETIENCIKLWTNPGETVFDPFGGIGSTPVVALRTGRRGVMVELKDSYFRQAVKNLESEQLQGQLDLFDAPAIAEAVP
jgi:DNA modification methylase